MDIISEDFMIMMFYELELSQVAISVLNIFMCVLYNTALFWMACL
jgi:hypothetical protein